MLRLELVVRSRVLGVDSPQESSNHVVTGVASRVRSLGTV